MDSSVSVLSAVRSVGSFVTQIDWRPKTVHWSTKRSVISEICIYKKWLIWMKIDLLLNGVGWIQNFAPNTQHISFCRELIRLNFSHPGDGQLKCLRLCPKLLRIASKMLPHSFGPFTMSVNSCTIERVVLPTSVHHTDYPITFYV